MFSITVSICSKTLTFCINSNRTFKTIREKLKDLGYDVDYLYDSKKRYKDTDTLCSCLVKGTTNKLSAKLTVRRILMKNSGIVVKPPHTDESDEDSPMEYSSGSDSDSNSEYSSDEQPVMAKEQEYDMMMRYIDKEIGRK